MSLAAPWAWVRRRARRADVRLHDLRHSFASVAVSNGHTLPVIGALLGHTQAATTHRYAHLMDDPLRAASDATAASIQAALAGRPWHLVYRVPADYARFVSGPTRNEFLIFL